MHNLLGMLQHISVHRVGATFNNRDRLPEMIQLHQPAQVLPKGNAATIRNRLAKWTPLCSSGPSQHFGGLELELCLRDVPLKAQVLPSCFSLTHLFAALAPSSVSKQLTICFAA